MEIIVKGKIGNLLCPGFPVRVFSSEAWVLLGSKIDIINPRPIGSIIENAINKINEENVHLADSIFIDSYSCCCLFIEGRIKRYHHRIIIDSKRIVIQGVKFSVRSREKLFRLVISPENRRIQIGSEYEIFAEI